MDYVKNVFKREKADYQYDLSQSTKEEDQALADLIDQIDPALEHKLVYLFVQRCKLKNSLMFLQFRKCLPNARIHDIREIFEDRKKFINEKV